MSHYNLVITTYNGADRIGRTLESIKTQIEHSKKVTADNFHIFLMNNASTDNTKEVAEKYLDQLPLTIVDASEPGKSKAANVAVNNHIKGDVIFFTDDDTAFTENWLDNFITTIEAQPDYDVFAGRIIGTWEQELDPDLASWIPMGSTYAIHDRTESGECEPRLVWGPNMAMRKRVFDSGMRFDERIGPMPKKLYPMGEETAFARRAVDKGFKCYFVGDAIVEHTIKAATANEDWIIRRAERLGYGLLAVQGGKNYKREMSDIIPLPLEIIIKRTIWATFYPLSFLMPRCKKRFWSQWKRYYYRGLWRGYREFVMNHG